MSSEYEDEVSGVTKADFLPVQLPAASWHRGHEVVARMQWEAKLFDLHNARGLKGPDPSKFTLCEFAVAHALGRVWMPPANFRTDPDIAPDIAVKGIDSLFTEKSPKSLLVPPYQVHDDWKFVLVLWENQMKPLFHIVGWAWGREVRRQPLEDRGRQDRDPAHFYEWRKLRPWRTLP